MELRDLLSILSRDDSITIKTEDRVKPFRIENAYVKDVAEHLPEWLDAFVSGLTLNYCGEYVITIIPED